MGIETADNIGLTQKETSKKEEREEEEEIA